MADAQRVDIKTNTHLIIADGSSAVTLTVEAYDENNRLINNPEYAIWVDGSEINGNKWVADLPGEYVVYAKVDEVESEPLWITARAVRAYEALSIPVVFHIYHSNEPVGSGTNLSADTIQAALNTLNDYFANRKNSTNPNAVDLKITFRLAQYDKYGAFLLEPGIHRIDMTPYDNGWGNEYDIAGDGVMGPNESWKANGQNFWNPKEYKNIFVMPTGGGNWATAYPEAVAGINDDAWEKLFDDLVVHPGALESHVLAHEMGHAFNLGHVFYWSDVDNCSLEDGYDPDNAADTYDQHKIVRDTIEKGIWIRDLIHSVK